MRKLFTLCLVVASLASCGRKSEVLIPIVDVTIGRNSSSATLAAEVAATTEARERGLMGRRSLAAGAGMLFVFPAPVDGGFWMKDTLIPLDIAFISNGSIAEIDSMIPCHVANCPLTTPAKPYEMALEVTPGYFSSHHLGVGASVTIRGTLPPAS